MPSTAPLVAPPNDAAAATALISLAGGRLRMEVANTESPTYGGLENVADRSGVRWHFARPTLVGESAPRAIHSRDALLPMPREDGDSRSIASTYITGFVCSNAQLEPGRLGSVPTAFGTTALVVQTDDECQHEVRDPVSDGDEARIGLWLLVESPEGSIIVVGLERDWDASEFEGDELRARLDAEWSWALSLVPRLRAGVAYSPHAYEVHVNPRTEDGTGESLALPRGFVSDFDFEEVDATSHRFHRLGPNGTPVFTVWYYQAGEQRGMPTARLTPVALRACGATSPVQIAGHSFRCYPYDRAALNWRSIPQPDDVYHVLVSERRQPMGDGVEHTVFSIAGPLTEENRRDAEFLIRHIERLRSPPTE